jgi:hypothetical protein
LKTLKEFAACVFLGALATGIPFVLLGRIHDPLDAPFRPVSVYLVQFILLTAGWVAAVRKSLRCLTYEWSPLAFGFVGAWLAFLGYAYHASTRIFGGVPTLKEFALVLITFFWFSGWSPTFTMGLVGGLGVGFAIREGRSRAAEPE